MPEQFGNITIETLKGIGLAPLESGLARFMPAEGVTPPEFIRLPIEQILGESTNERSVEKMALAILLTPKILPALLLEKIALFAAREVLPLLERELIQDERPRQIIQSKERRLQGLAAADAGRQNVVSEIDDYANSNDTWTTAHAAAWAAVLAATRVAGTGDAAPENIARDAIENTVRAVSRASAWDDTWDGAGASAGIPAGDLMYTKIYRRLCELIVE